MTLTINLRGTNGAGKSTAALALLVPELTSRVTLAGVRCTTDGSTLLVGHYPEGKIGGCDRVKTFDLMRGAIDAAVAEGYPVVLFEGITVSTVFGSWAEYCVKQPFTWAYLDTPLELCLSRVRARNGGADFKEDLVRDKYRSIRATRDKALAAGFRVVDIHYEDAINELGVLASLGS